MELFSEIYGCYFTVVSRILEKARDGLTKVQIEQLVKDHGFYDSTFHLLPALISNEWNFFTQKENKYFSRLSEEIKRPLSGTEKSWLKALLADPRLKLFLDEEALTALTETLSDTPPLFLYDDFHFFDRHLDGDDYEDSAYIERFRTIINAIKNNYPLIIAYDSPKGKRTKRRYHPYKLCYSERDNKFRLQCAAFHSGRNRLERITLNLARMVSVEFSEGELEIREKLTALFRETLCTEPVVLEISKERNALERCMLQFASFERQTEYDKERDIYTCRIWFDSDDETELLIRILSFGPVVKVLEPKGFLNQIKARIERQIALVS
ncbi:MAG: WYL domain-containing protein [Lachnospiraceae bacterium]|nr:WYL domain-containing protein [Lachnospiraceae bacterium]